MNGNRRQVEVLAEKLRGELVVSVKKTTWDEAEADLQQAVILKLSTPKYYKIQDLATTLKKAWGAADVMFQEIDNRLVVAKFLKASDKERALEDGPWSFKGATVLMEPWSKGCSPESMQFTRMKVWIQVHNLPFVLRKPEIAKEFAKMSGKVIKDMHIGSEPQKIKFYRFKIELDITKPVLAGCVLKLEEDGMFGFHSSMSVCQICAKHEACLAMTQEAARGRLKPALREEGRRERCTLTPHRKTRTGSTPSPQPPPRKRRTTQSNTGEGHASV